MINIIETVIEFLANNWENILPIFVGGTALIVYILKERKKETVAASLIILQIAEVQEKLREISSFIVDGRLDQTAFYESLPLLDTDYWNKYKYHFVQEMDAASYTVLNEFYEYVSEIQEQQMFMKSFQKDYLKITQSVLANIETQFIMADLNHTCTGVTAQEFTSAMENMIPQGVSEKDQNFDENRFWWIYNKQRFWLESIIDKRSLTFYAPNQIRISLEKILKKCAMLEINGTSGYQMLKKISKRRF